MSRSEEYVPFGEEWVKEMLKWRKKDIVDFLREQLVARQNTKESPVNSKHQLKAAIALVRQHANILHEAGAYSLNLFLTVIEQRAAV